MTTKTTRINTGIYEITSNGMVFQAERCERDGAWLLYEMEPTLDWDGEQVTYQGQLIYSREYCNDFCTKREAVAAAIAISNEA